MALKNIYTKDASRVIRMIAVDNMTGASALSIDKKVKEVLSFFQKGSRAYIVENDGAIVGYYVVRFTNGLPVYELVAARKSALKQIGEKQLNQQVEQWTRKEFPKYTTTVQS